MKTRAAVLYESGVAGPYKETEPLKIEHLDLKPPRRNELLIRVRAAGLCHSDLSVINGSRKRPTPMALGHEAAGEVVEVGEGSDGFAVGDHVVCYFVPSCGECLPCMEGRPALCESGAAANNKGEMLAGDRRLTKDEDDIHHHLGVSGFAEYAVVSKHSAVKVDTDIPFHELAVFGCAVITGLGAVINTAEVKPGSTVAVIGLGGIGMNTLLGAKLTGAREIIAIDMNEEKLQHAQKLGATATFHAQNENVVSNIREYTDGGVDYAFETAGAVPAMETAYHVTRRGGMTITSGLPDPQDQFSFPQVTLTSEERTVKGSYLGSCVPARDIPRFISLYKQGRLPIDHLLGDRISLNDINEGFDRLASGKVSRIIVEM
ncbi:alcohol dehydrogenase [Geomicrobium halophilum]|uniref:Alcohol dehydrogenase n=1 Tax=Geomicrobium halophilum TaxID=549000 RepID=A0A841PP35_9BACL|nr:zinc-dependent alcohol dehydrogenase family protein [Geomicrobium halophilum]MBB6450509.1 alcohol dehydrogenase [Geomicrobium halophilum]